MLRQLSSTSSPIQINQARCRRLIEHAIGTFELDLSGWVVLTEAATGYYRLTPLIAAVARAEQVLALTRDSRYGSAVDACNGTMDLARCWNMADRIDVLFSRKDERISQADIVTNLGLVRPLDAPLLARLKPTAVIPLMWETWEYRPEDLDLIECRRRRIPVLGTNEHHPDLRIFEYVGHIALKLLFMLSVEVFRSRVVVIGSGEFAEQVLATLRAAGAQVTPLAPVTDGLLVSDTARHAFQQADAVVVVEHHTRRALIGPLGEIRPNELQALNPGLAVAHICGNVDRAALEAVGLQCCPNSFASPGYMSVATDHVGPRPLIDLHTAGLKVAECLARVRARGLSGKEAELATLKETPLAQGFAGYHDGTGTLELRA